MAWQAQKKTDIQQLKNGVLVSPSTHLFKVSWSVTIRLEERLYSINQNMYVVTTGVIVG